MSISDGLRTIAEFRVTSVSGTQGLGFHRLQFSLHGDIPAAIGAATLIHEPRIFVSAGPPGALKPLGTALPQTPWYWETNEYPANTQLLAFLDASNEQLSALERLRIGNPVCFRLDVSVVVERGTRGRQHGFEQLNFEVPVSTWAEILKTLGHAEILLVSLELPTSGVPAELEEAINHFREAHGHFVAGRYSSTVASCRMGIDAVNVLSNNSSQVDQALIQFGSKRSQMSKHDRALVVSAAVRNYTHLAHHLGTSAKAELFSRQDAQFILAATSAAIWDATGELAVK